ncbi:MAG: permease [Candidatus Limnocylindrales bacterium]
MTESRRPGTTIVTGNTGEEASVPAGGVATPVAYDQPDLVQQTQIVAPRDRVRWGPIVAGLLTAISTFLLLSLLATALGAQAVDAGGVNSNEADDAGTAGAIVSALLGLLAFFIGGFLAARTAAVRGRNNGLLNGFLVWALGVPLLLLLAGLGLGQVLGAAGDLLGQYRDLRTAAPDVDRDQLVEGIRNSAFGGFLGLLLPAIAAALGGYFGARDDREEVVDDRDPYRMSSTG